MTRAFGPADCFFFNGSALPCVNRQMGEGEAIARAVALIGSRRLSGHPLATRELVPETVPGQ